MDINIKNYNEFYVKVIRNENGDFLATQINGPKPYRYQFYPTKIDPNPSPDSNTDSTSEYGSMVDSIPSPSPNTNTILDSTSEYGSNVDSTPSPSPNTNTLDFITNDTKNKKQQSNQLSLYPKNEDLIKFPQNAENTNNENVKDLVKKNEYNIAVNNRNAIVDKERRANSNLERKNDVGYGGTRKKYKSKSRRKSK